MDIKAGTAVQTIKAYKPNNEILTRAAAILAAGGLVAFPTETVYGLGANGLDEAASKKIYEAKGRPSDNPLILHLFSAEQAENYALTSPLFYRLAMAFMPGPLTVVLPKKPIVPDAVTGGLRTVALRVPSHPVARGLLEKCAFPIAAPSANISGRPSPTTVGHVIEDLDGKIDMILDGGPCEIGLESTIVKLDEEHLTLLRPGAVTPEMLAPFCADLTLDRSLDKPLAEGERPLAPGMKYKHYAPKASVILLDGPADRIKTYMLERKDRANVGFMGDERLCEALDCDRAVCYGKDLKDEAHGLFDCLRAFDKMTEIKTVYAPLPVKEGIGLAVYNRLAKAAGFTILKI